MNKFAFGTGTSEYSPTPYHRSRWRRAIGTFYATPILRKLLLETPTARRESLDAHFPFHLNNAEISA